MARKKVSGLENYIIPLGIVGLGIFALYKLGFLGNTGSGLAPGSSPSMVSSSDNLSTGAQATNQEQSLSANITAQTWLNNYSQTRGQDCFTNALYLANPANATLGAGDALALYNLIHSQAGTWFTTGDFTGILAAFQNVVNNQTDVSYVANYFQDNNGMDLFQYITQANTFANGLNESGNNMQLVQQFVQWCIGLTQAGTEQ
jgi:hypothetical protein